MRSTPPAGWVVYEGRDYRGAPCWFWGPVGYPRPSTWRSGELDHYVSTAVDVARSRRQALKHMRRHHREMGWWGIDDRRRALFPTPPWAPWHTEAARDWALSDYYEGAR